MDWFKRLIAGLTGESKGSKGHTGGALAPASAQRTQLGIKAVDLPRGVVTLKSGEARAFLRVTAGFAVRSRSREDAIAWFQGYARALNTLPANAVVLARSRDGGLDEHLAAQRTQTAALAQRAPNSALAKLAADQLAHARHLQDSGQVRRTTQFVALHSPKGDVDRLLAAAEACRRHLKTAGIGAELVTDRRLTATLAADWHPGRQEEFWWECEFPAGGAVVARLDYAPEGRARVTTFPALPPAAGRATVQEALPSRTDGTSAKALPR